RWGGAGGCAWVGLPPARVSPTGAAYPPALVVEDMEIPTSTGTGFSGSSGAGSLGGGVSSRFGGGFCKAKALRVALTLSLTGSDGGVGAGGVGWGAATSKVTSSTDCRGRAVVFARAPSDVRVANATPCAANEQAKRATNERSRWAPMEVTASWARRPSEY